MYAHSFETARGMVVLWLCNTCSGVERRCMAPWVALYYVVWKSATEAEFKSIEVAAVAFVSSV